MQRERNLNLDIIRAVAISLVLAGHVFIGIGYPGETLRGMVDVFPLSIWIVTHACNPIFLMLSGWLGKNKTLSGRYYRGLIKIVGVYVLCSLACIVFRGLYLHEEISLRYVIGSVINFYACDYAWYACMYIGLFLMMPFLNIIYKGLDSRNKRLALIATMFALSSMPSLLNQFVQIYSIWWSRLFPILFYFVGAFLSDYRPKISAGKGLILTLAALLVFSSFDVYMYKDQAVAILAITNEHYQIFFTGLLVFITLLGLDAKAMPKGLSRAVVRVSELSYAMYLLSWMPDNILYKLVMDNVADVYDRCSLILPVAAASFVVSVVLASLMMALFKPVEKLVHRLLDIVSARFTREEVKL